MKFNENQEPTKKVEIGLYGNVGSGKNTLLEAFSGRRYVVPHYRACMDAYTSLVEFGNDLVEVNMIQHMAMSEPSSFEDHRVMALNYRSSDDLRAYILCYDCTNLASLQDLENCWVVDVAKIVRSRGIFLPYILVGNKLDQKDQQPNDYIDEEQAKIFQRRIGARKQFQCSALDSMKSGMISKKIREIYKSAITLALFPEERLWTSCLQCTIL